MQRPTTPDMCTIKHAKALNSLFSHIHIQLFGATYLSKARGTLRYDPNADYCSFNYWDSQAKMKKLRKVIINQLIGVNVANLKFRWVW